MRFIFNDRKAAQAAAHLLARYERPMPYIKLLKMLYLGDRQSLIETGYPITGAQMVSMDHGPVLSEVLDRITWDTGGSVWSEYISAPSEWHVRLLKASDGLELSDYESDLLDRVHDKYGAWDRWDLVRYTHTLPEWTNPDGSALPIDVRVILRESGSSEREICEIAAQVESVWAFHRMAASARSVQAKHFSTSTLSATCGSS